MTTVYGVEIPEPRTLQLAFHEETEFGTFHFGEGTIVIAEEDYGFHENPDNTFNLFNKFVVSHEVSHWVHNMVYLDEGIFPPLDAGDYRYDAQDADCNWCTNLDEPEECPEREHALRSAELSHAAVIEGFAQFGAAVTYNDPTEGDGVFRYYKDLAAFPEYDDLVDGYYQVSLENDDEGGTDAWVQTMCLPDYNSPDNEGPHVSSEIDWMRTFWRFVTDDTYSGSLASVADVHTIVVEAAHNNWNADIIDPGPPPIVDDTYAWQAVVEAADDLLQPVQDERLGEITAALGVYNPPP
jgi:hypothetical protein